MQLVNPRKPVQGIAYIVIALLGAIIVGADPLVSAVLDALIAFGSTMTEAQRESIETLARIVFQLIGAAGIVKIGANVGESQVTPTAHPRLEAGSEVEVLSRAGNVTGDLVRIEASPPGPSAIDAETGEEVHAGPIPDG
jgi:hypothetical protein